MVAFELMLESRPKRTTKAGKQHTPSLYDHMASLPTLLEFMYTLASGVMVLKLFYADTMVPGVSLPMTVAYPGGGVLRVLKHPPKPEQCNQ